MGVTPFRLVLLFGRAGMLSCKAEPAALILTGWAGSRGGREPHPLAGVSRSTVGVKHYSIV